LEVKPQTLYVVGTPIGNLADITYRAIEVLRQVDLIAAEDTRHTGILLKHFAIQTRQVSFHSHNTQARLQELLTQLPTRSIALVSDAGMPAISDPGWELIQGTIAAGFRVVPIPGVTAVITALVASGLPTDRFVFEGFLPLEKQSRHARMGSWATETRTIVFYEAPHRLRQTLTDLIDHLGETRPVAIGRELTKQFEEFYRGTLAEALDHFTRHPPKGEFTIVLGGAPPPPGAWTEAQIRAALQDLLHQGMSRSEASRELADLTGLAKRQIYQWSLEIDANP